MDVFTNKVSNDKFKSTNSLWNGLGLNKAWSVGYTTTLIKQKRFKTKEEWHNFYFESGELRLKEIEKLTEDEMLLFNKKTPSKNAELNKLNYEYGRTKKEIAQKGNILYEAILKEGNPYKLTQEDCQYIAYYRVVCETWNGVMARELSTKDNLINQLKELGYEIEILDTNGAFDYAYAVDFEIYYNGTISCGLQIKPESYRNGGTKYIEQAKIINRQKNKKYTDKFNRNVYYVYSDYKGKISNKEIIDIITNELKELELVIV